MKSSLKIYAGSTAHNAAGRWPVHEKKKVGRPRLQAAAFHVCITHLPINHAQEYQIQTTQTRTNQSCCLVSLLTATVAGPARKKKKAANRHPLEALPSTSWPQSHLWRRKRRENNLVFLFQTGCTESGMPNSGQSPQVASFQCFCTSSWFSSRRIVLRDPIRAVCVVFDMALERFCALRDNDSMPSRPFLLIAPSYNSPEEH